MNYTEDLPAFLDDFGVIAQGGTCTLNGVSAEGIFDNGYNASFGMDGTQPSLLVKSSDASGAVRGTAVVVNSVSYTVQGIEPDGTGMTKLILEKV